MPNEATEQLSGAAASALQVQRQRKGLSLEGKLNLIVTVSIVAVTVSLLLIAAAAFGGKVDNKYYERIENASEISAFLVEPEGPALL